MNHPKTYASKTLKTQAGDLVLEGPVPAERLAALSFHEGLKAFRPAGRQQEALVDIAALPEGRIVLARFGDQVVGYVTYLYPDPMERWSEARLANLLELGAIEVAAPYRAGGVAKGLLDVSFQDDNMNDYIVISTEYYWHWDLDATGISVWDYKEVMKKIMGSVGMEAFATDDPEICSHPANMLMARIGTRVDQASIERFHEIRFTGRHLF
ncbi:N-acetyltransferase [Tumebacillus permanentifrigoris]|uniref:Acetoin utilization protein AcuA n=1 Tax=Tumebacillus permanentifrigoris TaxID=378543 RepID=A0A316DFA7_9BACL|nr:N-acetyltransferase [Tumebacillus permanentifrigoris]PWK15879.1 acetoin utilization protein AcuA [Tumebacillus permanentifrigoris]